MSKKVHRIVLATIGIVAVTAIVVAAFIFLRDDEPRQSEDHDTSAAETGAAFTEENAEYLEEKFNSPAKEEQALALVPTMRAGEWDSSALFPEGSILEIDHASFDRDGEGDIYTVQASAVLDGEAVETYTLYIVYVEPEEKWLVGGTTKIEGE